MAKSAGRGGGASGGGGAAGRSAEGEGRIIPQLTQEDIAERTRRQAEFMGRYAGVNEARKREAYQAQQDIPEAQELVKRKRTEAEAAERWYQLSRNTIWVSDSGVANNKIMAERARAELREAESRLQRLQDIVHGYFVVNKGT